MLQNKDEGLLNKKYYFLRRSVISYYARCVNNTDDTQNNYYDVPCEFQEIMSFVEDLFYTYLKEEYKGIVKK